MISLRNNIKLIHFTYIYFGLCKSQILINIWTKFYAHLRHIEFINKNQECIASSLHLVRNLYNLDKSQINLL